MNAPLLELRTRDSDTAMEYIQNPSAMINMVISMMAASQNGHEPPPGPEPLIHQTGSSALF